MGKRNIYKDIVILGAVILCILFLAGKAKAWRQAQEMCGMSIQSSSDLTAETIAELEKLPGMVLFLPTDTTAVKLELEEYTLETEIMGIGLGDALRKTGPMGIALGDVPQETEPVGTRLGDISPETEQSEIGSVEYPLQWETAELQIRLGNTPMFFLGKECFASFQDQYGHAPTKSQIEKWQQDYPQLELTLTDESGHSQTAKICGILNSPAAKICIEKAQMQEIFGQLSRTRGGYLQIQGRQNAKKAQDLLEGAGFQVTSCGMKKYTKP